MKSRLILLAALLVLPACSPRPSSEPPPPIPAAPATAEAGWTPAAGDPEASASPGEAPVGETEFLLEPGHAGPVGPDSSEEDLEALLGPEQVRPGDVHVAEGEMQPGAVLYPDDPERRIEVAWQDAAGRSRPSFARVSGSRSAWHTPQEITLGTSLSDLERLNGKPFRLLGLGWDYAGAVVEWEGGALAGLQAGDAGGVVLRLGEPEGAPPELVEPVLGDREFSSDDPGMRKLNPVVGEIVVRFPGP